MEIKILDNILHGNLKPWKLNTTDTRRLGELVRAAKNVEPSTSAELQKQLTALLADHPGLQLLINQASANASDLRSLSWYAELPKYKDVVTQFYWLLITNETLRLYNTILQQATNWTELVDIRYQVGKALTSIKVLAQQATEELNERQFAAIPDDQSNVVHFALYYLKHSLIQLYFSVQEAFKESLQQVITLEDFYMIELQEPLANMLELNYAGDTTAPPIKKNLKAEKLTFGFNGKKEKLTTAINNLCVHIELLKESISPADMLIQLLLSKDIKPGDVQIHLDCDNKNFRYVIQMLSPFFTSLSFINIQHSKSFYSKQGTLLKANNFSKARSFDPKEKAKIDNIFKQMQ